MYYCPPNIHAYIHSYWYLVVRYYGGFCEEVSVRKQDVIQYHNAIPLNNTRGPPHDYMTPLLQYRQLDCLLLKYPEILICKAMMIQ